MIGLDFGTTNSCAALAEEYLGDVATVSAAPHQARSYDAVLPSAVLDPLSDEPLIGSSAEEAFGLLSASERDARTYLSSFKLLLDEYRLKHSRLVPDHKVWEYHPHEQIDVQRTIYREESSDDPYTRDELVGAATALTGHLMSRAVEGRAKRDQLMLGMPVSFSSRARKRMVCALYRTGLFESYEDLLDRLKFVLEPIAAAAAGMREASDADDREIVLVFDHGGGTLDMSVIEFERRPDFDFPVPVREVVPATGAPYVAGGAFDLALRAELCVDGEVRRVLDEHDHQQALGFVRRAKEDLSVAEEAELVTELGAYPVTRKILERAAAPLLGRIEQELRRLLDSSALEGNEVSRVLMTGGSSLIPCVQDRVRSVFPELSSQGRVRAYDPTDEGDVERAMTEIAQGLAYLGGDDDMQRLVMWDVELLNSEGKRFEPVARRGDQYGTGSDGRPELRRQIEITDPNGDGMAIGLWEAQLDKRFFLFGLADVPPIEGTATLDVVLRPEALYPRVTLTDEDGNSVERPEVVTGWEADRVVAADIHQLSEGQLQDFFEQDEVDYLPMTGFRHFRHAPLTRIVGIGDRVEWADLSTTRPGQVRRRRAGEIIAIRRIGSHAPLEELQDFDLHEHELTIRLDHGGGRIKVTQPYGTMRISTTG